MKKILSIAVVLEILSISLFLAQAEGLLTEVQQVFFDNKEATVTSMVEDSLSGNSNQNSRGNRGRGGK